MAHISEVLERLRKAGLNANTSKCQFALRSIECLGHVLENVLIKMDNSKVEAIKNLKVPQTKRQ